MNITLNVVWPSALPLPRVDYSGEPRIATLVSSTGSAAIARRSRTPKVYATVNATWALSPTEYAAFRIFFETTLHMGTSQFKLELRYPLNSALTFWSVRFVGGYQVGHEDRTRIVTAQLDLIQLFNLPGSDVPEGYEQFQVVGPEDFVTAGENFLVLE